MSQSVDTTVPAPSSNGDSHAESCVEKKSKPTRVLPTNRVALAKQWEILRAFGIISGTENKSVTNMDVSKIVSLHHATVGLITPFFIDAGLLKKGDGGLTPVPEVGDFARAYEWNPEEAFRRCAPVLRRTWFFETLRPKLQFKPGMTRGALVEELAINASAGTNYRGQVETLLDYLSEAGLIAIDGDQVKLGQDSKADPDPMKESNHKEAAPTAHQPQTGVVNSFAAVPGLVEFNIAVKVNMAELAAWQPARISAFFAGIAQVVAAKGAVEEKSTRG